MSRLEEIKDDLAIKAGFENWDDLIYIHVNEDLIHGLNQFEDVVCKIYAKECSQSSLEKASENVTLESLEMFGGSFLGSPKVVNKESITNPDNIVLL